MVKTKNMVWKDLQRDARGRWLPKDKKKTSERDKPYKSPRKTKRRDIRVSSSSKDIEKVLDQIGQDFQKSCPRCAGDMVKHWIRCGPNKLVEVKKCGICNFWLPISSD